MKKFRTPNIQISALEFNNNVLKEERITLQLRKLQDDFFEYQSTFKEESRKLEAELEELKNQTEIITFFLSPQIGFSKATIKGNEYWMGRIKIPKGIQMSDGSKTPRYLSFVVGDLKSLPDSESKEFNVQLKSRAKECIHKNFDAIKKV
jgi:hypothetical protein